MRTRVGYTGGTSADPTYQRIGDHAEALQIDFDPRVVSYAELLELFWSSHNPLRPSWSTQYMAAVFCDGDEQATLASASAEAQEQRLSAPVTTRIDALSRFYRAEDYHQKYKLRREKDITAELVTRFGSDRAMVDSTVAARLNGYLGGWGKRRELQTELDSLRLSEASEQRLLVRVA